MAVSFSPKIPLTSGNTHYDMISDLTENIKQNFKNLLLTSPGERVMIPNFGCGLRRFLFESTQISPQVQAEIQNVILKQVKEYLRYITLNQIIIRNPITPEGEVLESNLEVYISYSVPSINLTDAILIEP